MTGAQRVNTLLKQGAFVQFDGPQPQIGNDANGYANILAVDLPATNGIIHALDDVLVPAQ